MLRILGLSTRKEMEGMKLLLHTCSFVSNLFPTEINNPNSALMNPDNEESTSTIKAFEISRVDHVDQFCYYSLLEDCFLPVCTIKAYEINWMAHVDQFR